MRDATEIVVILDRSSSMGSIKSATIEGFNSFLQDQKNVPGEAHFTLVEFNTEVKRHARVPIKDAKTLTEGTYLCTGCTALLDAVGIGIDKLGEDLRNIAEADRPDKVIFVIMTDGEENSSKEYKVADIRQRIETQEKDYNWKIIFLGANIDAFAEGGQIGVRAAQVANFQASAKGVQRAYSAVSDGIRSYRLCGDLDAMERNLTDLNEASSRPDPDQN